jgi:glyoxylase-like metal-dependent hydrolase (beta-lactamase superfamily II)
MRKPLGVPMTTQIKLGEITIDRVVEQELPFVLPLDFFPTLTPALLEENLSWMQPDFIDPASGMLIICVQSYLVRTPHHNILIDACVRQPKSRPTRPVWDKMVSDRYEKSLAATGLGVGDIDYVMCTHLHTDHVGWNTRLDNGRWVPTFPKARYLFSDRELAYWTEKENADPAAHPWITDSVLPVVAAKRVEPVKSDHVLNELVRFIPTPGHTPDHFCVQVGKSGADALIAGDMIHSPLQARYPELGMRADYNSAQAGETRRRMLGRLCDTSTLLCTCHFPSPSMGRVERWDDGFKVVPV